jgi:hypothetical protein
VLHDWSGCYRLLRGGDALVADLQLQRQPLRMPLQASCTLEGPDIVLALDPQSAAALLGSNVSVSVAVTDRRTAARWRVVVFGTAEGCSREIRVRPTTVVGYCVGMGAVHPELCA